MDIWAPIPRKPSRADKDHEILTETVSYDFIIIDVEGLPLIREWVIHRVAERAVERLQEEDKNDE